MPVKSGVANDRVLCYYHCKKWGDQMKTLTICGSMRFANEMKKIAWDLEYNKGYCVIQLVYNDGNEISAEGKLRLDAAHRRKIELSDGIYVVNIGGYIGESVRNEIALAENLGKEIIYHER